MVPLEIHCLHYHRVFLYVCVRVCVCCHMGVHALTSMYIYLGTELLAIFLQTISDSIIFSLHHEAFCIYAKSIITQIMCLGSREGLVAFILLPPLLAEGWKK